MSNRKTELAGAVATLRGAKVNGGVPKVGQLGVQDKTIYLNFSAAGQAGIVNLIDSNTRKIIGVTNLDGNKLNPGRDYIIDSIRFMNAAGTDIMAADYTNGVPVAMKNAEFRIVQGSNNLLEMPVSDLTGDLVAKDILAGFRNISTLPMIRSNEEFAFELEYAKGTTVPAAGTTASGGLCVRIEMRVHQAKK